MPPKKKARSDMSEEELEEVRRKDREKKRLSREREKNKPEQIKELPRRSCRTRNSSSTNQEATVASDSSSEKVEMLSSSESEEESTKKARKYNRKQKSSRRSSLKDEANSGNSDVQLQLAKEHNINKSQHSSSRKSVKELAMSGHSVAQKHLIEIHEVNKTSHSLRRTALKDSAEHGNVEAQDMITRTHQVDQIQHSIKRISSRKNDILPPVHYLGKMTKECKYCGALHFPGEIRCCQGGTVFIPPNKKMPSELHNLFYNTTGPEKSHFQKNIIRYNSLFAFASIQYNHVPQKKFGAQTTKTKGSIRHFTSALYPNQENNMHFANYYAFDHVRAAEYRTNAPYADGLDENIIAMLSKVFEQNHPFATLYKNMKEKIEEAKREGRSEYLKMKIVDIHEYEKHQLKLQLQGTHPGVYSKSQCGDFVSLYVSTNVDQQILPMGIFIYPKLGSKTPWPMFSFDRKIDSFCYPLLAPYGEEGFQEATWEHEKKMEFSQRLDRFIANDINGEHEHWDTIDSTDEENHDDKGGASNEVTIDEKNDNDDDDEVYEDTHEDVVDAENFDKEYENTIETRNMDDCENLTFEYRRGETYPSNNKSSPNEFEYDYDDDNLDVPTVDFPDDEAIVLDMNQNDHIQEADLLDATTSKSINDGNEVDDIVEMSEKETTEVLNVDITEKPKNTRKFVSRLEWVLYQCQRRTQFRNRIMSAGKIGQTYVMDQFSRILQNRLYYVQMHHTQSLRSTRRKLLEALQNRVNLKHPGIKIGAVTTIPASVVGSPRNMRKKFEDAVALSNKFGQPNVFITFTASSGWPEIKESLGRESWADNPFVVCEVFRKKYEKLLEVLCGKPRSAKSKDRSKGMWGEVIWYTFSVEFQQRGPPHIHLLLCLKNAPKSGDEIDKICCAELPVVPPSSDPRHEETKRLRQLVELHMVHRPCENDRTAYCKEGCKTNWKKCSKGFPKDFNSQTEYGDKKYPDLRRRNDGQFCEKKVNRTIYKADNRYVVAYSPQLLSMFECHCNVEIVTSNDSLKYLFKYVYKGFDRVLLETIAPDSSSYGASGKMTQSGHLLYPTNSELPRAVQIQRERDAIKLLKKENIPIQDEFGHPTVVYDETKQYEDCRAFTAIEAAWHISQYPISGGSHTVLTDFVHCPKEEPIVFKEGEEEKVAEKNEEEFRTAFKAWFAINNEAGEEGDRARQLTYDEMPRYFKYYKGEWKLRKRDWSRHIHGHIKSVHPRNLEQFAIRLLAAVVKGPTNFEELRTVNGVVFETFVEAAKELKLMNDQKEWDRALKEASSTEMPVVIRRLFISILVFNSPANGLDLWNNNKKEMYERKNWAEEKKEAHALKHIQYGLRAHGLELSSFQLPEFDPDDLPEFADYDYEDDDWTPEHHQKIADAQYEKLNDGQKQAMDTICNDLNAHKSKSYFVHGTGGTGKTFLYRTIYHHLRAKGLNVMCVAHTGIAATLLPNGMTAHRAFCLPLLVEENMHSTIEAETEWADVLRKVDIVVFDEATMVDRRVLAAIQEMFVNLHPHNQGMMFGGVTFLFGGDWRQTLPIVERVYNEGVLDYTIRRSEFWNNLTLLPLTKNERAAEDPEYAKWILEIGDGSHYEDLEWQLVKLPKNILAHSEAEIMRWVYGYNRINNPKTADYSCILTVDNKTTEELNDMALNYIKSPLVTFKSIDSYDPKSGFEALAPEAYNNMLPSGMPPHLLKIKIGCIVILLRNMDVHLGLCNGTRMRVVDIGENIIKCAPITENPRTPKIVLLSRFAMGSAKPTSKNVPFIRLQFPIRVAHSMTINKSQGQTLDRVGVILRTPVFSHGQLYVALSRVRRFADIKVFVHNENAPNITRNVVYKNVLLT